MKEHVGDFETASGVDLKIVGSSAYAQNPTTEVLCFSFEYDDRKLTWAPGDPFYTEEALLGLVNDPEVVFVAHNAGFEKDIWRYIMVPQFGFPDIPNSRWDDTMAVAAMKQVPQNLDTLSRILRLPGGKDTEGSRLTIGLSKPNKKTGMLPERTPEIMHRVYTYCESDIDQERGALNRLGHLSPGERKVWLLDQTINERGVKIDLPFVSACQAIVDKASGPLQEEFRELTGGLKVTQAVAIKEWCHDQGFEIPGLAKEVVEAIIGDETGEIPDDAEDYSFLGEPNAAVHRALSIRGLIGSASVKKLSRMEACAGSDGRVRRLLQYHGAGPGRWAGRLLQPQNFPRGTLKLDGEAPPPDLVVDAINSRDPDLVQALFGSPVNVVVSALRHALIADRRCQFLAGDFSTIEARVVLAIAGQADKLEVFRRADAGEKNPDGSKIDIYCDMAKQIYGRPIDKKKDPEERQAGKNSVLGLGFQMGAPKFRARYAKHLPIDFSKRIVNIYRKEWAPNVPPVWYGLEEAACRTVWDGTPHEAYGVRYKLHDGWLTARLPSGRHLWYWNPQKTRKAMPWDATDIRPAWTYQALKMGVWKTIDAFGGLLTENVVQALARDLLVAAMFKLEANGFPIVLTVHDEALAELLEAHVDELAFKEIMCEGEPWSRELRIPINVETWAGERYRK